MKNICYSVRVTLKNYTGTFVVLQKIVADFIVNFLKRSITRFNLVLEKYSTNLNLTNYLTTV